MTLTVLPSPNDEIEECSLSELMRQAVTIFPPAECSFDRLMERAVTEIGAANRLARKQTIYIIRAGADLAEARTKLPPGLSWVKALEAANIPRTTAWEAMKLFELAGSEDAVANLTITEAKQKYGITKPKKTDVDDEPDSQDIIGFDNNDDADPEDPELDGDERDEGDESEAEELGDDHTEDYDGDDEPDTESTAPIIKPSQSPFDTLAKIVRRLEYLEADLQANDSQDDPRDEFLQAIDRATEILGRIRQAISVEA